LLAEEEKQRSQDENENEEKLDNDVDYDEKLSNFIDLPNVTELDGAKEEVDPDTPNSDEKAANDIKVKFDANSFDQNDNLFEEGKISNSF